MFDSHTNTVIVAVATFVFFAGICWEHLATVVPSWVRVVVGVSAAVLSLVALLALLR
jgi:hypothetical protein